MVGNRRRTARRPIRSTRALAARRRSTATRWAKRPRADFQRGIKRFTKAHVAAVEDTAPALATALDKARKTWERDFWKTAPLPARKADGDSGGEVKLSAADIAAIRGAIAELRGEPWATALYDHLKILVQTGWANAAELLDIEADFKDVKPTFAMEALRKRVDDFTFMINDREQRALNMTLDAALDQGWTLSELADNIQQTFSEGYHVLAPDANGQIVVARRVPTDTWSEMVARTELNRAQTLGALSLYDAAGIKKVKWSTNGTPCDECAPLEGEIFDIADAPECPHHPYCNCALTPADDDVKFTEADAAASAEFMDAINQQNDAALQRYLDSKQ